METERNVYSAEQGGGQCPVCFLHIGKTGGTSLLSAFDKMLPPKLVCPVRQMDELEAAEKSYISKFLLFRGHFWYSIKNVLPRGTRFFTVLREPLSRVRSTYDHISRFPHGRHEVVKRMSFEEYLRSDNDISLEVDNWQTRVLTSEIDPSQTPSLSLAKKRLREMAMVGLTEELDVTLKLVSRVFGWPEVSGLGRLNSTIQPSEYSDLTDSAREFAARKNSLDVELYNYGKELFGELVRVHVLE